jgi:hypothetical protein
MEADMKRNVILLSLMLLLFIPVEGYYSLTDFIRMDSSSAAGALSGAYSAKAGDFNAMTYNPAGVYGIKSPDAAITYSVQGLDDLNGSYTRIAVPFDFGVLGTAYMYNRENSGDAKVNNGMFLLHYSNELVQYLNAGINIKFMNSSRLNESASFAAIDAGILYKLDDNLNLSMAVVDLGWEFGSFSDYAFYSEMAVPTVIKAGLDWKAAADNINSISISSDAGFGFYGSTAYLAVGLEYNYLKQFYLRIGDRVEKMEMENRFNDYASSGLGIDYDMNGIIFKIEYSYIPKVSGQDGFGETQVISLSAVF